MQKFSFVIIGAGPCGLGTAYRLQQLGISDFAVFEKENYAGGLATSFQDEKGFWWDIGGHVQFSHYEYFDGLMDQLLGNDWLYHNRESWVWLLDRFVPYPFQLNIHRLPAKQRAECLEGLRKIQKAKLAPPKNFEEWILQTSGAGIVKYFLNPYNYKVWAYPPKVLNTAWVGERVAITDLKRVEENIKKNRDDVSWGPNNQFRFPKVGGTGAIWKALAKKIPAEKIKFSHTVGHIDSNSHTITFSDGKTIAYEYLINTMPLDKFVQQSDFSGQIKKTTGRLLHSATHIVGIGLKGQPKADLKSKCWMYFPENNCPFYRVTLFSKYSPHNVPDINKNFSLMCEISGSIEKPVDEKNLVKAVIEGLKNTKLISDADEIISVWQYKTDYGYPTPSVERDEILSEVQPVLMKKNIYSRGRFGMWKYEVSNQDHSLMQGKEVVDFLVNGEPEITAWHPEVVNRKRK